VSEAALMLGLTDRRVRQLVDAGQIPSQGKTTTGHVVRVADVLAYRPGRRVVADGQTSAVPSTCQRTKSVRTAPGASPQ
jgi:hypothetical protein